MVAERARVIAQAVHQIDDRSPGLPCQIDVGVSRPAVAGVHEHDGGRVARLLDRFGQLWETFYFGMYVVGG